MMEMQAIWVIVIHYGYDAVVEFVVEISDHLVSHYVFVIVLKAGAIHIGYRVIKHVHKRIVTK